MATEVFSFWKTIARAVRSMRFSVTGAGVPSPPLTGNKGSGVITRIPTPTRISAQAGDAPNTAPNAIKPAKHFLIIVSTC